MTQSSPAAGPRPRLSVGFILAERFTLSAFSLFVDHLRLAADEGDSSRQILCRWSIMSSRGEPVTASCGVAITPSSGFVAPKTFDYIVVVGGLLHGRRQVDEATTDYLKTAARAGVPLIGICTGVFILSRAGLMDGRQSCVSWYHCQDFLDEFPHQSVVTDRLFIVDRDRITCSGGGGSADLAAYLIERHVGRGVAQKAGHILLLDRSHTGEEPQPHPRLDDDGAATIDDARVRRALLMMEQNLAEPVAIADLAGRVEISVRQLERLFQAGLGVRPALYYRTLRLRYAHWLLTRTERSVTDIALETGFSDCAHFSRQFRARYGDSPARFRRDRTARPARPAERAAASERAGVRLFSDA